MSDSLLDPAGNYSIFRKGRDSAGGGVCAFISKRLRCLDFNINNVSSDLDIVCFDILLKCSKYRFI